MARNRNIVSLGETDHEEALDETSVDQPTTVESEADEYVLEDEEFIEPHGRRWMDWVAPALAILAVGGWTVAFALANPTLLSGNIGLGDFVSLVRDWSLPVALVVATYLLVQRNSRRESARFAAAARALSEESSLLEARLTTVNRELSLARDFIASQSRDVEALGRVAVDRLTTNASQLEELIQTNNERIELIAAVSATALENMDKLRSDLPVVANSSRDVANQIGHAGETASQQLDQLVAGFERLNEFGNTSEQQVERLSASIDTSLEGFASQATKLEEIAVARFAEIAERSETFRQDMEAREVEAHAAIRRRANKLAEELADTHEAASAQEQESFNSLVTRLAMLRDEGKSIGASLDELQDTAVERWKGQIAQLSDDMRSAIGQVEEIDRKALEAANMRLQELSTEAMRIDAKVAELNERFEEDLERRRLANDERAQTAIAELATRLEELDGAVANRLEGQNAHVEALVGQGDALAAKLEELSGRMAVVSEQGATIGTSLDSSVAALYTRLEDGRTTLSEADEAVRSLTDASVRLLEIIQAGAAHSREELPEAISAAQEHLGAIEQRTAELAALVTQAEERGATLSSHIESAHAQTESTLANVETMHARFMERGESQLELIGKLATTMEELDVRGGEVSDRSREELTASIRELEEANTRAIDALESGNREAVQKFANAIGDESAAAIDKTLRTKTTEAIAQIEHAAAHATGVGREAAIQLRDQLAKVNELTGNLEARISHARERAEEQVDNDFARRMALITESLNSNAIDIAKAMSNEVTDTAWASYLRGDRGIFTRRAVRLLEGSESRAISDIFEEDADFREHVSRYIHDFENMLRSMLSTRDGNALAVTLLSSDMGKLYVALAQAIERLRD